MVVRKLGTACIDNASPIALNCFGCNGGLHLICLGISRQASLHLEELSEILKFVCESCNGTTLVDVTRSLIRINDRIDKQLDVSGAAVKKLADLKSATDMNTTLTDDMAESNENLMKKIVQINNDIVGLKNDTNLVLSTVNEIKDDIDAKFESLSNALKDSLSTQFSGFKKYVAEKLLSRDVEDSTLADRTISVIESTVKASVESAIQVDITNVTKNCSEAIESLERNIKRLQDEADIAANKLAEQSNIALNAERFSNCCSAQRSDESLLNELLRIPETDALFLTADDDVTNNQPSTVVGESNAAVESTIDSEPGRYVRAPKKSDTETQLVPNPFAIAVMRQRIEQVNADNAKVANKQVTTTAPGRIIKNKIASRTGQWMIETIHPPPRAKLTKSNPNQKRKVNVMANEALRKTSATVTQPNAYAHDQSNEQATNSWLYVAGFGNKVTASTVENYVKRRIGRNYVHASVLLPKGVEPGSRDQLSFKIRIPKSCEYTVLDRSFWPDHVVVRPFVNSQGFQTIRQGHRLASRLLFYHC